MTIYSWNVNGIRSAERKGFVPWLLASGADVACIQETKARPEQLPSTLRSPASGAVSYQSFWASAEKPGYSGTALYSRLPPDRVDVLGVPRFDTEGRVLAAHYGGTVVVSAYFPNSQEEGVRLPYKLDFCAAMLDFCAALVSGGKHVVLCGDYNIAHKPIDLNNPKVNEGSPGYLPEERAWLDSFVAAGFADTFRHFCAEGDRYTWWSYRARSREKNVGWRIDYQCVDEAFLPSVVSSEICASVLGSDHCPICLTTR